MWYYLNTMKLIYLSMFLVCVLEQAMSQNASCSGHCGDSFNSNLPCQCNTACVSFSDCCADYEAQCLSTSCSGKCGASYDRDLPCQCNTACQTYSNCCADYLTQCDSRYSCSGRCGAALDTSYPCQCNDACTRFGDCCFDFSSMCETGTGSPSGSISDEELLNLGDILWNADVNRFQPGELEVYFQRQTQISSTVDRASRNLFSYVSGARLSERSFSLFIALLDNYNPWVRQTEPVLTGVEQAETDEYLDFLLTTPVMNELMSFLVSKGRVNSGAEFRDLLSSIWFSFYPRSSSVNALDSSGFEHVFVGEKKQTSVTGFHNWVQMYLLEMNGNLNYWGYNYLAQPDLFEAHFSWDGLEKDRGSMFIGTTPEFEMALYTMCFVAKPGSVCQTSIMGNRVNIQTYDVSHASGQQVATAYPMINGV